MKIIKNKLLASLTTFNIGGPADYFIEAKTEKEISKAVFWAKENKVPYYILGLGSNVLVSDKGVRGLVIQVKSKKLSTFAKATADKQVKRNLIFAETGISLSKLLMICQLNNLSGLEGLIGIPGTVGGAIWGNAGTNLGNIGERVVKVKVLTPDLKVLTLNNKDCCFGYRSSRFKTSKEVILEAVIKLKKEKSVVIKEKITQALALRKDQPQGFSAGSIFKNPKHHSAGYLIEKAGLKGKKIGGAVISKQHGNWILNINQAKAKDVLQLIRLIQEKVWTFFKVKLDLEINLLGEF